MFSRLLPALVLGVAVPAAAFLAASPAGAEPSPDAAPQAASVCSSTKITSVSTSSKAISVGTKKTKSVDLDVAVSDACASTKVEVTFHSPGKTRTFTADKVDRLQGEGLNGSTVDVTYYTVGIDLKPKRLQPTDAGIWHTSVELKTELGNTKKDGPDFSVRHATRTSFNAKPDTVGKGRTTKLLGHLTQADWTTQRYVHKPHDEVVLQWRPKGVSTFRDVTPLAVDDGAAWGTELKLTGSGCFRGVYPGNATLAPVTSRTDCVRVR